MVVTEVEEEKVEAGTSDPAGNVTPGRVRIDRFDVTLGPLLHLAPEE